MEIIKLKTEELINWDLNPREIGEKDFESLVKYVQKYGLLSPLLVDGNDMHTVLGGNMRLKVIKHLGWKEVECSIVRPASEDEKVEIALLDNAKFGSYIKEKLAVLVGSVNIGMDIKVSMNEIRIGDVLDRYMRKQGKIGDNEVPETDVDEIRVGDVVEMGHHKLICGDSTLDDTYTKLMGDNKSDMIFTDPPYNVALGMNESPEEARKRNRRTDGKIVQNDKFKSGEDFYQFLLNAFTGMANAIKTGGSIYVCHTDSEGLNFRKAFIDAGFDLKQCIIWNKNSLIMGRQDYQWKHEPILYGWRKGGSHTFYGGRKEVTVWDIPKPSRSKDHPTMKPVELIVRAIANSSKGEDIILDPFGGSGSTLIACEKTDRRCFTIELDPRYCNVIVNRWCEFTGNSMIKINGKDINWNELKKKDGKD